MIFKDRSEAALLLLNKLMKFKSSSTVVLAVPRGAIPMAVLISHGLECPMNLAPVRKVASPLAPEFALGAADIEGNFYPEESAYGLPPEQLRQWFKKSLELLRQRHFRWRQMLSPLVLKDRTVIIVDDGVATGSTMKAALMWARRKEPAKIVVAVPVASAEGAQIIERFSDESVCLYLPKSFTSVCEFYANFEEITDESVFEILCSQMHKRKAEEHAQDI